MAATIPTRAETAARLAAAHRKLPAGQAQARTRAIEAVTAAAEAFEDDEAARQALAQELLALLDAPAEDKGQA